MRLHAQDMLTTCSRHAQALTRSGGTVTKRVCGLFLHVISGFFANAEHLAGEISGRESRAHAERQA